MMKLPIIRIIIFLISIPLAAAFAYGQNCFDSAKITPPSLSAETQKDFEAKLNAAKSDLEKDTSSADALIWLGRRTAYLGRYKEAIQIFTEGIEKHPKDARFYRHRGHRFITLRCLDDAIRDFERAAKLIKGKPDEIEPDGLPNARNIPTSTLQSNIWYHLGLAYYLKGNFRKALKAHREDIKVSKNPDMLVASSHWLYMTLRRLGKEKEAQKAIADIKDDLEIIENDDYYKLIKLYQGKQKAEDLLASMGGKADSLSNASLGYGIGNWYLYNGKKDEAEKIFKQILNGNQWASFGYIAAERELAK